MSDLKRYKAPKDFERFNIWGYLFVEPDVRHNLFIWTETYAEVLTDKSLQGLIEETKEFYDKLINLRDSLNKDK